MAEAGPVLLEPVMEVEVVTPDDFIGPVQGDLNSRRGQIRGIEVRPGGQALAAEVPLSTMFGYVNNLRSMTPGPANYPMQIPHYTQVPSAIADELVAR